MVSLKNLFCRKVFIFLTYVPQNRHVQNWPLCAVGSTLSIDFVHLILLLNLLAMGNVVANLNICVTTKMYYITHIIRTPKTTRNTRRGPAHFSFDFRLKV